MCKVFNTIGCLNTLQIHLVQNNVDEFHSLTELIEFRKDYQINKDKIISSHKLFIEKEKLALEKDLCQINDKIFQERIEIDNQLRKLLDNLNQEIEDLPETKSKIIPTIKDYLYNLVICTKFWSAQLKYHYDIFIFSRRTKKSISQKNKRLELISANFEIAVQESACRDLQKFELKREIIEKLNNNIYGAIGEQKVENALKKLSDDYILINDFCCTFHPPIYNKRNNDHIHSIQIDHLLICSSGIFLIETKNWSNKSLNNQALRSPVEQILRTNFALFALINDKINSLNNSFFQHSWGNKKVPIRNIIVFTNNKPFEEFQFVKMVTLDELIPYIKYFSPTLHENEVNMFADFLLSFSEQRKSYSKLAI